MGRCGSIPGTCVVVAQVWNLHHTKRVVVLAIHVCRATSLWLHIRCPPTIAIQAANSISIALYIFGIPVFFFAVLWKAAMPQSNQPEWDSKDPYMGRFGMLYASYHPRCWWWELLELVRKLILTGVIVFVGTGTVSQSWFAMITAQFFLLMMTRFQQYGVKQIDHLSFVAQVGYFLGGGTTGLSFPPSGNLLHLHSTHTQVCTLGTLLVALVMQTDVIEEGWLTIERIDGMLIFMQIFPFLFALVYNFGSNTRAWKVSLLWRAPFSPPLGA